MKFKLYHYWRSSSSWRVRWALELKGIKPNYVHIDLLSGESESPSHLARHPFGYVPVLELEADQGETGVWPRRIIESVAMIEWLDEVFPAPSLYSGDAFDRAHIRALAEVINADTQPIQNVTVFEKHSSDLQERQAWVRYFIERGLGVYQKLAQARAGKFSVGDQITACDLFLIPQCYNALRFGINLATEFPLLERIYANALATSACHATAPEQFKP